jgi:hypothetical protein
MAARAARAGLEVVAVSSLAMSVTLKPGILLGYAGFTPPAIEAGVRLLAQALGGPRGSGSGPEARRGRLGLESAAE